MKIIINAVCSRKRLPSEKWILRFPQNWIQGILLDRTWKTDIWRANFEKCTFEKITFQVFGGYKKGKKSYLSTAYFNLAEIWLWDVWSIHVLILQVYQNLLTECGIPLVNLVAAAFQRHSFCEFLTQFAPISGPPIVFLWAATKINNKDTLKVSWKITTITDPNLSFFLSNGVKFEDEIPGRTLKIND